MERCIRKVLNGDQEGNEIGNNAVKWSELAREAVGEGGGLDRNIDEFDSLLKTMEIGSYKTPIATSCGWLGQQKRQNFRRSLWKNDSIILLIRWIYLR